MSEIPDDIMQAARKLLDTLQWDIDSADADRERIARAILAERKRCAKVAEAHPIDPIIARAKAAAAKASIRFPQPNYVALKIAEEAGEVVRGCVHYAEKRMEWGEVEGEIVQLIAMLIRLVTEGDHINGVFPPAIRGGSHE